MQIPAFTTSQRAFHPLIPPSLGINYAFHFKPFFPTKHVPIPFHSLSLIQTSVAKAITTHHEAVVAETDLSNGHNEQPRFIDIGYVAGIHGYQGDVRVKSNTDFPQLRFATPGRRWLRQKVMSGETVKEVELEEGREHSGQNCWLIKFRGIDSAEEATMLIGATLLVTEEDKPELEDGEFYAHDLNGMRVFLKENGQLLGTVINVFNNGGNDLLQISLDSSFDVLDQNGKPKPEEIETSGQLVLVPFVEAIVPDVDMNKREMHITPLKGLLEINLRFDDRSKKERRQLEWKERKKFQKRLIAAKKKLSEMDQQHVFHGFQCGKKEERSLLNDQIVGVNSRLLQDVLQSLEQPAKRWNAAELVSAVQEKRISTIHISEKSFLTGSKDKLVRDIVNMQEKGLELISKLHISEKSYLNESKDKLVRSFMNMEEKGLELISKGKMAIVLLLNEKENEECVYDPDVVENEETETSTLPVFQNLLRDHEKFLKVKDRASVPLILVSSAQQIQFVRNLFAKNNHFDFDSEKVFFLEEEKLPVVRSSPEGPNKYKILMKSPWEILQSPVGSGGFISLFSKHNIAGNLINMGVEYVELCCPCQTTVGGNSLLLGLINSREAKIGIQISPTIADPDENFDMILSMDLVKKLTKQSYKLQFDAVPKTNSYVENVEKDWITVTSSTPNSYELSCSVYSFLNACPLDKVCIVEVRE
ncbi:uncharacterized protein LOC131603351 [Vicia villosa]|uniref:uncharacterized protein LOC131603351 n=1 Tax=Vicia villosa TaxID=3911 RepID=UPI00273A9D19|nr:uncharacterized protein LOC131603351 [Vicia villosa]